MKALFISLISLLLACGMPARAMTAGSGDTDFPERIFGFVEAAQGDSLYARLHSSLSGQVTAAQLSAVYGQITAQAGPLVARGPWRTANVGGFVEHRCRVTFERAELDFSIIVDDSQHLRSILFTMPQPAAPPPTPSTVGEAHDVEVTTDSLRLPGTLLLPRQRSGRVPVVVLVHGSGPNDRNETLGPNAFFRDLADSLAAAGIATLRYDKRTYVYRERTAAVSGRIDYDTEVVDDALSALRLVAARPEVDTTRIYVLGHSLGGCLVPRIARRAAAMPAGIIAVAAPARHIDVLMREQLDYIGKVTAQTEAQTDSIYRQFIATMPADYLQQDLRYNATATARRVACPQLYLGGSHDYQVTRTDFDLWQRALKQKKNAVFRWLPGLDHLMRRLPAMAVPADYGRHVPIAPEAVAAIVDFVGTSAR